MPTFRINIAGSPNSCIINIGKRKFRSLVDTGASVSLMHARVYNSMGHLPRLTKERVSLQTSNGDNLTVIGSVKIPFRIGGLNVEHTFFVVPNLNSNFILGRDWLTTNGVRIYFDLGCIRIRKTYIPLQEDIHISSLVRIANKVILKPQTVTHCSGKVKSHFCKSNSTSLQISAIETRFLRNRPGLMITNAVTKVSENQRCS